VAIVIPVVYVCKHGSELIVVHVRESSDGGVLLQRYLFTRGSLLRLKFQLIALGLVAPSRPLSYSFVARVRVGVVGKGKLATVTECTTLPVCCPYGEPSDDGL
jgi:hypothetical protein